MEQEDVIREVSAEVVKDIRESFNCVVCMDLMYKPCTLICGHSFCKHCIANEKENKCPTCRAVYIRPIDYNRQLALVAERLFIVEYNKRMKELDAGMGDAAAAKEKEELYSKMYREVAENARNEYSRAPPPTFDRLVESLDSLRKNPEIVFLAVRWYNTIIMAVNIATMVLIAVDVTDVAIGLCVGLLFISFLYHMFSPVLVGWIKYGEGVFRVMNSRSGQQRNAPSFVSEIRNGVMPQGMQLNMQSNMPGNNVVMQQTGPRTITVGPLSEEEAGRMGAYLQALGGINLPQPPRVPSPPPAPRSPPSSNMLPPYAEMLAAMRSRQPRDEAYGDSVPDEDMPDLAAD